MALTANPLDSLLSDLRTISNESKRKFPPLREAAEAAILKVRTLTSKNHQNIDVRQALFDESVRILEPFIMVACKRCAMLYQLDIHSRFMM